MPKSFFNPKSVCTVSDLTSIFLKWIVLASLPNQFELMVKTWSLAKTAVELHGCLKCRNTHKSIHCLHYHYNEL
uniref:Uncharacterized protein n=1 Tax=Anguilla anguilla TaxID=7936 RepID=A0A0E9VZ71_ANGAN